VANNPKKGFSPIDTDVSSVIPMIQQPSQEWTVVLKTLLKFQEWVLSSSQEWIMIWRWMWDRILFNKIIEFDDLDIPPL
jgi:hypothetical protein